MPIYWSANDIPALQGLSDEEKKAAKKSVSSKVERLWQVWLPTWSWVVACVVFFFYMPNFPYRYPVYVACGYLLGRVAALPRIHYLQVFLSGYKPTTTAQG